MYLVKIAINLFGFIFTYQMYLFATSRQGVERQRTCQGMGIGCLTLGILFLVSRDIYFSIGGMILIMFGFRLVSHGLDRLGKTKFIDRVEYSSND